MKQFRSYKSIDIEDLHEQAESLSGYEREKAVERLGNIGNIKSISVLLTRINDWVPQVRDIAKESLLKLCTHENANSFIHKLPNLFHLQRCSRENHDYLINSVIQYLLEPENKSLIVDNISNHDRKIARICLMLSIEHNLEEPEKLIQLSFEHHDVIVRSNAFELFKPSLQGISKPLIELAQNDTFMPIRRETLRMLWETSKDVEQAKKFLFDRHSSVRTLANRFLQESKCQQEVESLYIDELSTISSVHKTRCAIWAIGHLKLTRHKNDVIQHLSSTYSSVRTQALVTLSNLNIDDINKRLETSLNDASPSVRKQSIKLHKVRDLSYSADQLIFLQQTAIDKECADSCFLISSLSNRWERLIFFLLLLESKHSTKLEDDFIKKQISSWSKDANRVATSPTPSQIIRLRNLVKENINLFDLDHSLRFLMKAFGVTNI